MSLGDIEDKVQEDSSEETTNLTLNLDQAIILHQALEAFSNDCNTRGSVLSKINLKDETLTTEDIDRIKENLNLIKYIQKRLPYLRKDVRECIIFLQKESDSIIKGLNQS